MNSSDYQALSLLLSVINYAFIFLFIFSALKINYYNKIVSVFIKAYKPFSKLSLLPNQQLNIIFLAILIKFLSLFLLYSSSYDAIVLFGVAIIQNLQIILNTVLVINLYSIFYEARINRKTKKMRRSWNASARCCHKARAAEPPPQFSRRRMSPLNSFNCIAFTLMH